jgi:DNA primase
MINEGLLSIVESVLGHGISKSRNNYAFKCPNGCHPTKHKLEVNLETQQYKCWICGNQKNGFKGNKIATLFKKTKQPYTKFIKLKEILKETFIYNDNNSEYVKEEIISLPSEFKYLYDISKSDILGLHAINYLKRRGLTKKDILKYNIGYCETGEYQKCVIIPSYDDDNNLNYFIARSFEPDSYRKYIMPPFSKNIIFNENMINWDLPIIICEGIFDAISIKRNSIPLLGKFFSEKLLQKIISSSVKKIYVALDNDALKDSLLICEYLMNEGKEVYFVNMKEKDPNELGFYKFNNIIQQTHPLTYSDFFKLKLI